MNTAPTNNPLQARLLARAQQTQPSDAVPFIVGGIAVGFTTIDIASALASTLEPFQLSDFQLVLSDKLDTIKARSAALNEAALQLKQAGLLRGWRDEQLDVRAWNDINGTSPVLAHIERAACRPLGITTLAVHLNAFLPDGTLLVAQRALHKQIDPGLWDSLVGGMVPAGESEEHALLRETMEEAGLALDMQAHRVRRGGRIHISRPVPEGWESEVVQVFDAVLPADVALKNQDGEVSCIEAWPTERVLQAIDDNEFTLEAGLSTLDALLRRQTQNFSA